MPQISIVLRRLQDQGKIHQVRRSQILEIIQGVGVEASEGVLRSLVDQSSNKPGLAVTIARLWLQGEWQKILDGSVLSHTILTLFGDLVGKEAAEVLAAFSLGGSAGVSPAAVSEFLQLRPGELDRIAAGLAAGGVLSESGPRWLVKPEPLRSALLREIFFSVRPTAHDYRKLLRSVPVPDYDKAVEAVLSAKLYGGTIESGELREMISRSKGDRPWKGLAYVSSGDARWVMESYRGELLELAEALLHQIPEEVIPKILERAADFLRTGDFRPERAMSALSSWVQDLNVGPAELIRRRRMVARAARQFLLSGGDRSTGVNAICIALTPAVRRSVLDPAIGNTVITRSGLLPVESLQEIAQIWGEVVDAIQEIDPPSWQHLSSALWDWLYPEHAARRSEISDEERRSTRALAEQMLKDLAKRSAGSPGLRAELSRLAAKIGLDLGTEQDEVFGLLYPPRSAEEYRSRQVQRNEAVRRLAVEWARESPEEVAARIAFYEQEAQRINYGWMQNMPALCRALAESVDEPEKWLDALLRSNLRGHLISPFLEKTVELRREGWEQRVKDGLETEVLAWTAASLILTLPEPPPALLDRVFSKIGDQTPLVEGLCLRKEVPLATLRSLLNFPAWETALAAAVGEWCSDPEGEVREEIYPEWRAAILRARTEDYEDAEHKVGLQYWLGPILASDPDLALEWLRSRLRDPDLPWHFMGDSPFSIAAHALRREQVEDLLEELAPAEILQSLIPALVGRDIDLYKRSLGLVDLKDYHLVAVGGPQAQDWEDFALAALDAGYSPELVASASFGTSHFFAGSGIEYWERWNQAFAAFEGHPRADLREVVRYGRKRAQAKVIDAQKRQRHVELHGLSRDG